LAALARALPCFFCICTIRWLCVRPRRHTRSETSTTQSESSKSVVSGGQSTMVVGLKYPNREGRG
jgi:hypothetical protein